MTPAEKQLLFQAINKYGKSWFQGETHIKTRSGQQAHYKWKSISRSLTYLEEEKRFIKEKVTNVNLGKWTPAEEQLLIQAVNKYGKSWVQVEAYIKTRSALQAHRKWKSMSRSQVSTDETDATESKDPSLSSNSMKMPTDDLPLRKSENDDETSSQVLVKSNNQVEKNTGPWTDEEHKLFLQAQNVHGNFWVKIASIVKTRSAQQVATHGKFFDKMQSKPNPELKAGNWSKAEHQLLLDAQEIYDKNCEKIAAHVEISHLQWCYGFHLCRQLQDHILLKLTAIDVLNQRLGRRYHI